MPPTEASDMVADDLLMHLAFQRGILTLLKDSGFYQPLIDQALEDIDLKILRIR